ncbi:MAG: hypothetical protein JL50_10830 [Peptococcaceae bacterium BICA1-7]|nr:MAG: hypothetical protein JL50_10830 [Peptococcaceae bacterium BICA1-7]HBV95778.1 hypothetical protein [Desulfotomaculum sp.]
MPVAPEKIYEAIKAGRIDPTRLSDKHKAELKSYIQSKNTPTPSANMGLLRKNDVVAPPSGMGGLRQTEATAPKLATPQIPQRSTAERVARGVRIPLQTIGRAATLGIGGSGGLIERKMSSLIGADLDPVLAPETGVEKGLAIGGEITGSLAPIGGLYKLATPAAARLIPTATKLPQKIAKAALPGAMSGGTYEGARSAIEGDPLPEIAKNAALGAAIFGGGDVAARGLIKGVQKAVSSLRRNTGEESFKTGMDIGEGAVEQRLLPEFTTDVGAIRQRGMVGNRLGLPMSQGEAAVKSRLGTPLLPGAVDDVVKSGGSTAQSGLPSVAGEKVMREYAEKTGLAWPPTDETLAVIRERFKNSPEIIKRWQSVYSKVTPSVSAPTLPTAELNSARQILKSTTNLDRAAKILDTFPELRSEFKMLAYRIRQRKPPVVTPLKPPKVEVTPPVELVAARSILKTTKNPARIQKIFEVYPELKAEFPKIAKWVDKQAAKGTLKAPPVKTDIPRPAAGGEGRILDDDPTKLKDLGGWRLNMTDVYRNFKDVFGKNYDSVKKRILDPFDDSKRANVVYQEKLLSKLKTDIVDRLGIKKGSKESALVQQYGENKITIEQLKLMRPNDWQKIVEADKWFRAEYDRLIDEVNAVRRQIYPNAEKTMNNIKAKIEATKTNGKLTATERQEIIKELEAKFEDAMRGKFVPKRNDYYRHFNEMAEGIGGLKNIFDTPANIDPALMGISDFTLPKGRFAGFMQKRGLGPYKDDAVGGFINYVPSASYSIHIDPHVSKFTSLADELTEATRDSRNINNFIGYLRKFSQDLAGKTNPFFDRTVMDNIPGGRMAFNVLTWANNRVKGNTVLANAASAMAQTANIPVGIAHSKQYAVPGVGRALKSIFVPDKEIAKSGFIKERFGGYGSKLYSQFDTRIIDQPKKFAVWVMTSADKLGTHFIWHSAYAKGIAKGVDNPIRYADGVARSLVAGRGIGEVPLNQKAKMFQLVAPFQLEVANLWSVMRDFVKAKDFGAIALLFLGNHMFNGVMKETRGSGVVFDPIQAMMDAMEEDLTPVERGGRIAGEVLSNVPLGQTVANAEFLFPEYGGTNMLGIDMPTRKKLFGRSDPTRFGTDLLVAKGLKEPQYKIFPPFGGGQLKKTLGGLKALETNSVDDKKGNIKYPIAPDLANRTKGLLFGPGGFREAQDYYKNERRPLSKSQTATLRASGNSPQEYNSLMFKREIESIDRKIAEVNKDKKLSVNEREKQLQALSNKKARLMRGGR